MADADEVVARLQAQARRPLHRALAEREGPGARARRAAASTSSGSISLTASATFLEAQPEQRTLEDNIAAQHEHDPRSTSSTACRSTAARIMAAFGCNFEGDMLDAARARHDRSRLRHRRRARPHDQAASRSPTRWRWATPLSIKRAGRRGARRYPDLTPVAASARHARHGGRQRLCRAGDGRRDLRLRGRPASAAARSPRTRAPPATSAPRTSCSCARRWASRPASTSTS